MKLKVKRGREKLRKMIEKEKGGSNSEGVFLELGVKHGYTLTFR